MARIIGYFGENDEEGLTDLDHLVNVVSARGTSEYKGMEKAFSVRAPIGLAANLRGMAAHGKVSQNQLMCDLLEFAVHEVYDRLDDETKAAVNKLSSDEMALMFEEKEAAK